MEKYIYISDQIRNRILQDKTIKPNQPLKTEQEFCEEYNASKMTVKKALDILVGEGLIYKKRGLGTFVKNIPDSQLDGLETSKTQHLRGFSTYHSGENVSTRVIAYNVIACSTALAQKLRISAGDFVYHIQRVRMIDGCPRVYEDTYMPIDRIPGLKKEHIERSIYDYIRNVLHYKIQSAYISITAAKCPTEIADYLETKVDDPIVCVEQTAYLDNGQIFEYSISSHRFEFYEFHDFVVP